MNILIKSLSDSLSKYNLGITVKKETNKNFECYLYDLDDCQVLDSKIKDYRNCLKFDVTYRISDLYVMKANNTLKSFAQKEKQAYDMANKLNLLRR